MMLQNDFSVSGQIACAVKCIHIHLFRTIRTLACYTINLVDYQIADVFFSDLVSQKKKKGVSIVALWERASKANKRTSTSTPNPPDVEVENSSIIPPTIESNLQLALVQAHEPDDGHPEPESVAGFPTPIVEDDEGNDEVQFEVDLEAFESDPGKQIPISTYNVNDQDKVRRRYIELGACQPKNHNFEYRDISGLQHRFSPSWFKDYKWLEYSVDKEAAFCFVCYLFKDKTRCPDGDAFVKKGFNIL